MRILFMLMFAISVFLFANIVHADSLKRADKDDIEMLLSAASGMNSAFWASYIGKARGRVYIQYEAVVHSNSLFKGKMRHVVYWLPEEELLAAQLAKFIEYKNKHEPTK